MSSVSQLTSCNAQLHRGPLWPIREARRPHWRRCWCGDPFFFFSAGGSSKKASDHQIWGYRWIPPKNHGGWLVKGGVKTIRHYIYIYKYWWWSPSMNWLTNWFFFLTSTFTVWPWKWHFLSENKNLPPTDDRVYVWRDDAIHLTSLWVHLGVVEWLQCQWDLGNAALTHGCHGSHGPCPFFFTWIARP